MGDGAEKQRRGDGQEKTRQLLPRSRSWIAADDSAWSVAMSRNPRHWRGRPEKWTWQPFFLSAFFSSSLLFSSCFCVFFPTGSFYGLSFIPDAQPAFCVLFIIASSWHRRTVEWTCQPHRRTQRNDSIGKRRRWVDEPIEPADDVLIIAFRCKMVNTALSIHPPAPPPPDSAMWRGPPFGLPIRTTTTTSVVNTRPQHAHSSGHRCNRFAPAQSSSRKGKSTEIASAALSMRHFISFQRPISSMLNVVRDGALRFWRRSPSTGLALLRLPLVLNRVVLSHVGYFSHPQNQHPPETDLEKKTCSQQLPSFNSHKSGLKYFINSELLAVYAKMLKIKYY